VEDISIVGGTNRHNLTIELETVPPENTIAQGARLRVRASLQAGSAQLGEFFDVYAWLDAGAAIANLALGAEITATASLAAGAASAESGGPTDPNFANVSLLLLGDGTNGSTTITDSSALALTMTAGGNAQISTAQAKFGTSSIYFDGAGDRVSTPDDNALDFPSSGIFTIEGWIRSAVNPASYSAQYAHLFGKGNGVNSGTYALALYLSKLYFVYGGSLFAGTTTVAANQWYHVAVTRDSSQVIRLFLDGNLQSSTTNGAALTSASSFNVGDRQGSDPSLQYPFNGYIEQVRVTKGIARYTANFTPPTAAFPTS
jgi:hypothetical protein